MKKIILLMILTFSIFFGINAQAAQLYYNDAYHDYDGGEIALTINGKKLAASSLPMNPVIIDGRTMVPVREVFEALGSSVLWHDDTCQVEINDNGISVLIKIGDRTTYVNGKPVLIAADQPLPMLIGRDAQSLKSMVPVRFIAEKLNYSVGWDEATRTVSISKKKPNSGGNIVDDNTPIADGYGNFSGVRTASDANYDYIYVRTRYGISPSISRLSNPDRIVCDFSGASFNTSGDTIPMNGGCVNEVRYANYNGAARVVLECAADSQIMVMSSSSGILLRVQKSVNTQIMYDAFARRVYFDKAYNGSGKAVGNGYTVTFSDLSLATQKITVNDGIIYEIIIQKTSGGCTVTVDGSNDLSYTPAGGIVRGSAPAQNTSKPPVAGNVEGRKTVIIDPGHGGNDPGAIGYASNGKPAAYESLINLAIGKKVRDKLTSAGINVIMTRDTDVFIPLAGRAEIENSSSCDVFVSIHCNSLDNSAIGGTQVYYHPSSPQGTVLANNIYDSMVKLTGLTPKKTQNGSHLYVIRTTKSPAALVETAFISNPSDRSYLLSDSGQDTIARAIAEGIIKTLNEI